MNPDVILRPEARAELAEAHDYLEQLRAGTGAALADAVVDTCNRIAANPLIGRVVPPGVR